jgi:hypothetical protein
MSICLSPDEIADLTDYRRRDKQIEELVRRKIPFAVTGRGTIKVVRSHVESQTKREMVGREPDYGAI